jgi:hypothetical protein
MNWEQIIENKKGAKHLGSIDERKREVEMEETKSGQKSWVEIIKARSGASGLIGTARRPGMVCIITGE